MIPGSISMIFIYKVVRFSNSQLNDSILWVSAVADSILAIYWRSMVNVCKWGCDNKATHRGLLNYFLLLLFPIKFVVVGQLLQTPF